MRHHSAFNHITVTYWSSAEDNFDSYGRLTRSHAVSDPAGTPDDLVDLNYAYDDLGNPTWRYDALQNGSGGAPKWSQHYQYDRRSQLTKAVQGEMDGNWSESTPTMTSPDNTWVWHGEHEGETYSLDAMGNWEKYLTKDGVADVRAHNTSNQITNRTVNDQQRTVAFDAAGNMTDNGSSYKCVYDFLNRLIEVTRQDDTTVAKYYYDGLNRRIRKIEYEFNGTAEESDVRYLYDVDWCVIEERDENDSSALVARYIYGTQYIDDPVVMYRDHNSDDDFADTNEVLYYLQDRLFNVVALTDVCGEVVERIVYEPYGRTTCRRTSNNAEAVYSHFGNPYLFTGRRLDSDAVGDSTCFYLYRNRYYSAALGRFINRDPIGYASGLNLYWYVQNRPIYATDPTGECTYAAKDESGINAAHDAYCKAAGNDPTDEGMGRANKCFCEVTNLVNSLINPSGVTQLARHPIGPWPSGCNDWLKCMGECIFQFWSAWQASQGDKPYQEVKLTKPAKASGGVTPAGSPDPNGCWSGKMVMEFTDPKTNKQYKGTINELCKDPKSIGCCYAMSTCEKHSLVACTAKCKAKQMVKMILVDLCAEMDTSLPIVYTEDCLKLFAALPPLKVPLIKQPINYHYDAPLEQQIRESKDVCCDNPFWLKK